MKRFHVNVTVADLTESRRFYTTLFGAEPTVVKPDYLKWMLEDPRVNFSIATGEGPKGINHVGIQAESVDELGQIQARVKEAGEMVFDQPDAQCCYARSSKTWVRDPDDVSWETFVTFGESTVYGGDRVPEDLQNPSVAENPACCTTAEKDCCTIA